MHYFIEDMHKVFEIYKYYPPKMDEKFTQNAMRLSIHGKKKGHYLEIELSSKNEGCLDLFELLYIVFCK